jgi:hypothetical protein
VPSRGDSEQWIRDTLTRLLAQQEVLARSVAELVAREASRAEAEAQAEAILRRAASPDRPRRPVPPRRGRRGDTILHVVRAALVAVLAVGVVVALMAPRHLTEQRYTPRSTVQVAHVHNDHDADDR